MGNNERSNGFHPFTGRLMVCIRFCLKSKAQKRHLWKWEAMGNKQKLSSKLKVAGSNPAGVTTSFVPYPEFLAFNSISAKHAGPYWSVGITGRQRPQKMRAASQPPAGSN
jgi:hypothetical protein